MNRPSSIPALLQGEERRITVPGGTLAARAWGNPDGRRFFALHGWLDNANSHNALAPLLPELHIVALDFAGHGHSTHRPPGAHYFPLADIQDVIAAAEALGWDRFGLIGHSMGAGIASETAGLFPERITEAVFIDGMVHHQGSAADCNDRNRKAIEQMLRAHEKRAPVYPDTEAMTERVSAATDQSPAAARELVARGHVEVEGGVTWRTDPRIRFATPLRISSRQIDALMAATTANCLLLTASRGERWYRAGLERRLEHHRNLTVEEIDGPHHLHLEPDHVAGVAERIRRFLKLDPAPTD